MKVLRRFLAISIACVIAFSTVATTVSGADAKGTVNASLLNLRAAASTSAAILTQIPGGVSVTVNETANGWAKVIYNDKVGYVSQQYLTLQNGTTTSILNLRADASTSSSILTQMPLGATLTITSVKPGWAKVTYNGLTGYASLDYIQFGQGQAKTSAAAPVAPSAPAMPNRSGAVTSKGQAVLELAKQHLGKAYVYGATGPNNFDCSGLVYYVYKQMGVTLSRVAHDQMSNGVAVSVDQLQPGDIVGFSKGNGYVHHVGIYAGNGMMIHAPQTGDVVKYESIVTGNYANRLVGARRIF